MLLLLEQLTAGPHAAEFDIDMNKG